MRARAALAAATEAEAGDRRPLLAAAESDAGRLERERVPWATALATLVRASVAACGGQGPTAVGLLRDAVDRFEALDMELFAAAARRRLGELAGGPDGQDMAAAATKWMLDQGIKKPDRFVAAYAPGFMLSGGA
jgi:hypothetical protein